MSRAPQDEKAVSTSLTDNPTTKVPSRRKFLGQVGGAAAAALTVSAISFEPALGSDSTKAQATPSGNLKGQARANASYNTKRNAAGTELVQPIPNHPDNGDQENYPTFVGNYSKGMPHFALGLPNQGEVDANAYAAYLTAVNSGLPADWEAIPLGGNRKFTNPLSGLAYDIEGLDSHQLNSKRALNPTVAFPVSPSVFSQERADEMVENYWMALLRDVNFTDYGTNATALAAQAELTNLPKFKGKNGSGQVNSQNLFRGINPGVTTGPYMSQFLLQPFSFGALSVTQHFNTYVPSIDYMTSAQNWLDVQNGVAQAANTSAALPVYMRNGRDMSAWVHIDVLYQAYFNSMLFLLGSGAKFNPGNPYNTSVTMNGFGTFGGPHIQALMCEAAGRALKAVWYQKWWVHHTLRPEAFGGLVHFQKTNNQYPKIHSDVLNSAALAQVEAQYPGNYFLPMAFPEGSPTHPSYGSGHATVAGACVTILKAFFDDTQLFSSLANGTATFQVASADGQSLVPYTGTDVANQTVGDELNKVADNIAQARNIAGVHWRSDAVESQFLGEQVAISILRDQKAVYDETFSGFSFTNFAGQYITV